MLWLEMLCADIVLLGCIAAGVLGGYALSWLILHREGQ